MATITGVFSPSRAQFDSSPVLATAAQGAHRTLPIMLALVKAHRRPLPLRTDHGIAFRLVGKLRTVVVPTFRPPLMRGIGRIKSDDERIKPRIGFNFSPQSVDNPNGRVHLLGSPPAPLNEGYRRNQVLA